MYHRIRVVELHCDADRDGGCNDLIPCGCFVRESSGENTPWEEIESETASFARRRGWVEVDRQWLCQDCAAARARATAAN